MVTYEQIRAAREGLFIGVCNQFIGAAHRRYQEESKPVLLQPHGENALPSTQRALENRTGLPALFTSTKGDQGPQYFTYFGWLTDVVDNQNKEEKEEARRVNNFTVEDDCFYGSDKFARMALVVIDIHPIWPHIPVSACSNMKGLTINENGGPSGWENSGSISRAAPRCLRHDLWPLLQLMREQRGTKEDETQNLPVEMG